MNKKILKLVKFIASGEGRSMEPCICPHDSLFVKPIAFKKIKVNDIVVFNQNKRIITHRIIYKRENYLIAKGDSNLKSDGKIYPRQIIGKVYQVKRNGKVFSPDNFYLIQSTLYFQEIVQIKHAFEKQKIDFVFLKGLPLRLHFEKNHPKRIYADCDVLINKKDFLKAEKIIEKFGYQKTDGKNKRVENNYFKNINGFTVIFDLHLEPAFLMTQFSGLEALYPQKFIDQLTKELLKNKKKIKINDEFFSILNTQYLILFLALHFFHHNFRGAFRLEFLDKVIRKSRVSTGDWQNMALIISNYQLTNFVYPVFVLLKKYYKTSLSRSFISTMKQWNNGTMERYLQINICDDEPRIKAGINRFKNLFFLSPEPWWKRWLVFFNPQIVYSIFWIVSYGLSKNKYLIMIKNILSIDNVCISFNFFIKKIPNVSFFDKIILIIKFNNISMHIDCIHNNIEMLTIAQSVFMIPPEIKGVIVEAGVYKGGSTAKLSLIAKITGRKLYAFDSFQGIPANKEVHKNPGDSISFTIPEGLFYGSLEEVKKNIKRFGASEVCVYKKGWFNKTMSYFHEPIAAIFLDVDLASSTKICLKYLYPLLQPDGVLYSHDGHLVSTARIYEDKSFWKNTIGSSQPNIEGLGRKKLLKIVKTNKMSLS